MPQYDWHIYDWLVSVPVGDIDARLAYRAAMPLAHRPPARTLAEATLDMRTAVGGAFPSLVRVFGWPWMREACLVALVVIFAFAHLTGEFDGATATEQAISAGALGLLILSQVALGIGRR